MAAIIIGELAWAAGSVYLQPRLPRALLLNAGMPLAAGGVLLLIGSATIGELRGFDMQNVSRASLLALAYLILFGSILGFSAYMFLLRRERASRVSTHAYVNPLIAVALGAVAVNEPITPAIVVASLVIASGVALVLARHAGPAASPRRTATRNGANGFDVDRRLLDRTAANADTGTRRGRGWRDAHAAAERHAARGELTFLHQARDADHH